MRDTWREALPPACVFSRRQRLEDSPHELAGKKLQPDGGDFVYTHFAIIVVSEKMRWRDVILAGEGGVGMIDLSG